MPTGRYAAPECGKRIGVRRQTAQQTMRRGLGAALLAAAFSLLGGRSFATECQTASTDAAIASPGALFQQIRYRTDAQVLNIGVIQRTDQQKCIWVYDVRLLTSSGAVVELDFAATDLTLLGAEAPAGDAAAITLLRAFGASPSEIGSMTSQHGKNDLGASTNADAKSGSTGGSAGGGGSSGGGSAGGPGGSGPGGGPGGGGPGGGAGGSGGSGGGGHGGI